MAHVFGLRAYLDQKCVIMLQFFGIRIEGLGIRAWDLGRRLRGRDAILGSKAKGKMLAQNP